MLHKFKKMASRFRFCYSPGGKFSLNTNLIGTRICPVADGGAVRQHMLKILNYKYDSALCSSILFHSFRAP